MNGIIKFADGSEIAVEINGNSYITDKMPSFPSDLSNITIASDEGIVRTIAHAELVECASVDGRYWFTLIEIPEQVRTQRYLRAQIEYISMMTGIDIDEG